MSTPNQRSVVLLSGGLDSVTVLAVAKARGDELYALSFSYGQRHRVELDCARRQAERIGVQTHEVVELASLGRLVASATALVTGGQAVPKDRDVDVEHDVPSTYVPARNTIFLSYALAWAESLDAPSIFIGVNALDYSGYPDCRPEFIAAYAQMANLGTRAGTQGRAPLQIETPLIDLRKNEIIALGLRHGVDYADTVSCYDPAFDDKGPLACGRCDSCQLRRRGFAQAGVRDPTRYQSA